MDATALRFGSEHVINHLDPNQSDGLRAHRHISLVLRWLESLRDMLPYPSTTMLRHSLLANYAGQIATVSLGIVMVPAYVRYLGVEAYGLIAVNAALQAWVQILDLGLSPTLCRELARAQDEASRKEAGVLLQSLEKFVPAMCALLLTLSVLVAPYFAKDWLHAGGLPVREIEIAFALMMLTASSRWHSSVYRAGMVGVDRQGTLNAVVVGFAVIRAALVVPVIARWPQIEVFFCGNWVRFSAKA